MSKIFNRKLLVVLSVVLILTMLFSACVKKGDITGPDTGITSGDISDTPSGDESISGDLPSGDVSDSEGDSDTPSGDIDDDTPSGDVQEPPVQPVEKQIYLDSLSYSYQSVGHGNLSIDKDSNGNTLSLYENGGEKEYKKGYYAHAYSTLVFDGIETMGFTRFSTVIGINKTARVSNTQTSLIFRIFVDNVEVFTSEQFNAYSESQYVEVDINGADRITLIADSLGGNGHDHAVWADCKLTYFDDIKPDLQAYDVEFPSPYTVTDASIKEMARAKAFDGTDLSDKITYTTNYKAGQTGEFTLTYKVSDGKVTAEKTVKMSVLSSQRYILNAQEQYLQEPFADYVYYGRSLLSKEARKAYDLIMERLLKVDISDSSVTSLTINLQENNIYILPNEVALIKRYLVYDETRLYYIYFWESGESAGITNTTKNGLVDSVTIKLYNGSGEYYNAQNNLNVWKNAESKVASFFSGLSNDMSEAQMLYKVQNAYRITISYSNEKYADGFYGAFILGRCICSGYSKGYSYLAQRLGIRVAYVVGTAGGAHAWNYLYADGNWYMTDTTWGSGDSYGLLGKDDMDSAGRYDHSNYSVMPVLSKSRYDLALMKYPLMSLKSEFLYNVGSKFDACELVSVNSNVEQKAPVVKAEYSGNIDFSKTGIYTIQVKATNSIGNIITGQCEIRVYADTDSLSLYTPTQSGNSNYAFRQVSLCQNGNEISFENGLYTKANGTLKLSFDISHNNYRFFSGYVGIDKVIRDNDPWGMYANATVRILADDTELFSLSSIGWKRNMTYFSVVIPDGTQKLVLEITDDSGQGGVGWGDCKLYS